MSGRRTEKVASELQRAVQGVISRGINDPRARGLITVTGVEVSKDFRDATVRVSVMPHDLETLTLHALRDASRHIRREAGERVAMKRLPELHFRLDPALRKQAEIIELLQRERGTGARVEPAHDSPDTDPTEEGPRE